jgi:hypothetical protein
VACASNLCHKIHKIQNTKYKIQKYHSTPAPAAQTDIIYTREQENNIGKQ